MEDSEKQNGNRKVWTKGGPSPNPGGRPKGSLGLSASLRRLLDEGGQEMLLRGIASILEDPKSRQFVPLVKEIFDRMEGRPTDARDRNFEKMLSQITLTPGRVSTPLPPAPEEDGVET